ncbi:hypothetical protein VCR1J2_460016 [Vibrio coralliirubri]|nr:hypothetical protein VCR1J2_460016 [Vibrio coralliirubri]
MTSVITRVESVAMGLNFFIFKLILDSLDYEMSKLSKINTRDQLVK